MRGSVENFGDYNTMRIMLQKHEGNLSAVIKEIQLAALPKQLGLGVLIGAPVWIGRTMVVGKISAHIKKLQEKKLEEKLEKALAEEEGKKDGEPPC